MAEHGPACKDEAERIRRFTEYFSVSLKNMVRALPDKRLFIALTGGL